MKILRSITSGSGSSFGGEMKQTQNDLFKSRSFGLERSIRYGTQILDNLPANTVDPKGFFVSPYINVLKGQVAAPTQIKAETAPSPVEITGSPKLVSEIAHPAADSKQLVPVPAAPQPINFVSDDIKSAQLAVEAALDSEPTINSVVTSQLHDENSNSGAYNA